MPKISEQEKEEDSYGEDSYGDQDHFLVSSDEDIRRPVKPSGKLNLRKCEKQESDEEYWNEDTDDDFSNKKQDNMKCTFNSDELAIVQSSEN